MSLLRLANRLDRKHKLAIAADLKHSELLIRKDLLSNFRQDNGRTNYNLIYNLANTHVKISNEKIESARTFCENVITLMDYLSANGGNESLSVLKNKLIELINIIAINKDLEFDSTFNGEKNQYKNVGELIFYVKPGGFNPSAQYGKARTGLNNIMNHCKKLVKDIDAVLGESSGIAPSRIKNEPTDLSYNKITKFLLSPDAEEYGFGSEIAKLNEVSGHDEWDWLFKYDPKLLAQMATIVRALDNGDIPKDPYNVKDKVKAMLARRNERLENNKEMFEDE